MKNILRILVLIIIFAVSAQSIEPIIIDSDMTLTESLEGSKAPQKVIKNQRLIDVKYYSFDGKIHQGQLVVHKDVVSDVKEIFKIIYDRKFPVAKCIPIVKYGWSDMESMLDNNTSAFNYRYIAGTKRLSNHAFGKAVDINPYNNPVVYPSGKVSPKGAKYDKSKPGTFYKDQFIVKEFLNRGWRWGGVWKKFKDNHHFDKK